MQTRVLISFLLLIMNGLCRAQDSIPAEIRVEERGDSMHFSSRLRPLRQIAGAPAAYYSYFWELGDGRFSWDTDPVYAYRDTGVYQVRLYATNNYDDGKAPPTRPRPVKIKKKTGGRDAWASHFFRGNGDIEMRINRYPKPGEDFVTVIGYRIQGNDSIGGSIVLFYNERQFGQEGFALADKRFYNHEDSSTWQSLLAGLETRQSVLAGRSEHRRTGWGAVDADREAGSPEVGDAEEAFSDDNMDFTGQAQSMLRSLDNTYSKHTVLHFPPIKHGEEKFVFMDMNTLPGMLQDTNATVGFSAMLIPDDPALSPEVCQIDMQIVASHDPNHFLLKSRRINYRFMKKNKELAYRIEFQNTGNGPTRNISIGVGIPKQLDPSSVSLKAMRPFCRPCDSVHDGGSCIVTIHRNDSVFFVFRNIYIPGLQQEAISDKDSTTGYIEYTARFLKKPKKIPFSTQAAIVFDKHTPIITNKATARYIKGLSPGFMVGYSVLPGNGGYSATGPLQFGYIMAPYAPSRPYFQVEAFVGLLQQDAFTSAVVKDQQDTLIGGLPFVVTGRQEKTTTQRNSFEITPLHYRYNLSDWFGIGGGAMAQINISEQTTVENTIYFTTQTLPLKVMTAATTAKSAVRWLGSWNAAPFVDLQLGRVRHGPVLGIRYIRLLTGDIRDRFWLYAGFKL